MAKLTRQLLLENPIDQYIKWQKDAFEAGGHKLSSMALATTGLEGMPSIRTVLLKEVTKVGFVFYSNSLCPVEFPGLHIYGYRYIIVKIYTFSGKWH